ncbi:hypothetical protein ACWD0J_08105 [Streptomyces sp. NPDC003011]
MYRRTERAAQVRAGAKALWIRREELFIVDDIDLRRMKVRGMLDSRRRIIRVESTNADKRRRAVIEGDHGLEPMAMFVGRGGRMPTRQRWEQIFDAAHLRAVGLSEEPRVGIVMPRGVRIHDTRHTFAVYMLRLLTKPLPGPADPPEAHRRHPLQTGTPAQPGHPHRSRTDQFPGGKTDRFPHNEGEASG